MLLIYCMVRYVVSMSLEASLLIELSQKVSIMTLYIYTIVYTCVVNAVLRN